MVSVNRVYFPNIFQLKRSAITIHHTVDNVSNQLHLGPAQKQIIFHLSG